MANLTTLVAFNGTDGSKPDTGSLIADANGDLFGTTEAGGASSDGTVFEIVHSASGYASTPTTLATFNGANGATPEAGLVADANGDLFGTTEAGGANGYGTVFEIVHSVSGYATTPTTVATFTSTTGSAPEGGLLVDANGDLFGTTSMSANYGGGTVFEIVHTASGYASTPKTLVAFNIANGGAPLAGLIADANGDLFGTTEGGGANSDGTVFEIVHSGSGYVSAPKILVAFNGSNGEAPVAGLIADANGDLFGTTDIGGANNDGTMFEIIHSASGYASTPTTLATFNMTNGANPASGLLADANGDLFGTTNGGPGYIGTIFEIAHSASGYASAPTTVFTFNGSDGYGIVAGLIADSEGDLFGETQNDEQTNTGGTVFELSDTGFVACYCRGTTILTEAGEVAVEDLAIGDAVVTASGAVRPIRWVGRRSYAGRFLLGKSHLMPILFRAGSLGGGLPRRDLRVSPAHAMLLDGLLIPAACLINGVSILRDEDCRRVDYFHVELDSHDVILAEGAASETFLDDDSRGLFHNAAEYAARYPAAPAPAGYCAPRVESGLELETVRRRLAAIARADLVAA